MTRVTAAMIGASVLLSTTGQMLLKAGVSTRDARIASDAGSIIAFLRAAALQPLVWLGLVAFGISVLLWLGVLSRVDVSTAYPFVALGLVLTAVFGHLVYGEAMSPTKLAGIALIAGGVVVLTRGAT